MNVLLIDDERIVTDAIQDRLNEIEFSKCFKGFSKIDVANDFYQAITYLDNQDKAYDIIISDLLIPGSGLMQNPSQTRGTVLNGWTFLYHYILDSSGTYHEKYKDDCKIVVFSAYKRELTQFLTKNNMQQYLDEVYFVEKGHIYNDNGGYASLIRTVKSLIES